MQKKKSLICFLVILIIILIFSAVMAVVYLKTDLFKSNKQLFYKYLLEENQMLEILNGNQYKEEKSHTSFGNIDILYEYNNQVEKIQNDQIAKNLQETIKKLEKLETLTGNIESIVDKENKKEYYKMELQKNENNIMNFELAINDNKYAFKSKEIANSYIGIENENLKDFFKKMGIENTEVIPNKIDFEKIYKALSEINSDEKEHVYETYKEVLLQSIDSKNYTKQKNQKIDINNNEYNTDMYSLSLSKTESINILIKVLETLKQDSITLNLICNKIKTINPDSKYSSISQLTEQIQLYIEEINKIEKSDKEFIRIDVYVDKKVVRKIDFSFENQKQISFEYEEKDEKQVLQIGQKNFVEEPNAIVYDLKESLLKTKQVKIIKEAEFTTYQFVMYNIKDIYKTILDDMEEQDDQTIKETRKIYEEYKLMDDESCQISFNIKIENERKEKTQTSIYMMICNSKVGINVTSEKKYDDNIEEIITLNKTNSIILNNYSKDTINKLLKAVINKGKEVLKNKLEI